MTSRNSSVKFPFPFRGKLSPYSSGAGVLIFSWISLGLFFLIGGPLFILYQRSHLAIPADSAASMVLIRKTLSGQFFQYGFLSGPSLLLTSVLALVTAIHGYSYLFSGRQIDFYLSQPVKRRDRFWKIFLNGFLTWFLPFMVTALLSLLIAGSMGAMNRTGILECLYGGGRMVVFFLAVYSISILAAALCGRLIFALLTAGFLFLAEGAVDLFITVLRSAYLVTSYGGRGAWYGNYRVLTSPFFAFALGRHRIRALFLRAGDGQATLAKVLEQDAGTLVWMALISLGAVLLAYLAFRMRKAESAGKTLVFHPVQTLIRVYFSVLIAVLSAVVIDQALSSLSGGLRTTIVLVVLIAVGFFTAGLSEAFIRTNIRKFFRRWPVILVSIGLALALFIGFRSDAFGYDTYLPRENEVKDAGLYLLDGEVHYEGGDKEADGDLEGQRTMHLTAVRPLRRIAVRGQALLVQKSRKSGGASRILTNIQTGFGGRIGGGSLTKDGTIKQGDGFDALLVWHLKNGQKVTRRLLIPYDIDPALMDPVLSSEEYLDSRLDLDGAAGLSEESDLTLSYMTPFDTKSLSETGGLMADFLQAYHTDLIRYNYSFVQENDVCGKVVWKTPSRSVSYDVYPSYTNTVSLLEEKGIWLDPLPDAGEIRRADVTRDSWTLSNGEEKDEKEVKSFDSEMQIRALLAITKANAILSDWKAAPRSQGFSEEEEKVVSYTIGLNLRDDAEDEIRISLPLDAEKIPSFVLDAFGT